MFDKNDFDYTAVIWIFFFVFYYYDYLYFYFSIWSLTSQTILFKFGVIDSFF